MPSSVQFEIAVADQRLADLEIRHRLTDEALRRDCAQLEDLQMATQIDELQVRRLLGKVQWLQGRRADLQEAMDRLSDGVCA